MKFSDLAKLYMQKHVARAKILRLVLIEWLVHIFLDSQISQVLRFSDFSDDPKVIALVVNSQNVSETLGWKPVKCQRTSHTARSHLAVF